MNVSRAEFITMLYLDLEPQLSELAHGANQAGIETDLMGSAGGPAPGVRVIVQGVGDLAYTWREGILWRRWRTAEQEEPSERESSLEQFGDILTEVRAMLRQAGFQD